MCCYPNLISAYPVAAQPYPKSTQQNSTKRYFEEPVREDAAVGGSVRFKVS
jgi:hypothetical protein